MLFELLSNQFCVLCFVLEITFGKYLCIVDARLIKHKTFISQVTGILFVYEYELVVYAQVEHLNFFLNIRTYKYYVSAQLVELIVWAERDGIV